MCGVDLSMTDNSNSRMAGTIEYRPFADEAELGRLTELIEHDLSEPYSAFTYLYFIRNWPQLCHLAYDGDRMVGVVICRLTHHKSGTLRGYIGMLAVDKDYRKRGIGSALTRQALETMRNMEADEIVLETEIVNSGAIRLYESLGFVRDKFLNRYYLGGQDALRLKLWLK
ncbi:uncharacterized protein MONBRDRAFT_29305 [Monosiga brevicollis MX1]|uniref:N-acetyltransferase domain-containing protein n=1 Tax=Monosiga brevicollis TaxID=81824 RepID=A9VAQ2_MONBE|nr:uncharacterized protein MONBRDRAFT_29305 [Monosiga brevicollis MX1]EDQ85413.1 predicted protein [Monosiga brevicollis MX1]|eukprot:XP_001749824.1 hypothetical protein [Monosiga brevicollis MX1]